MKNALCIGALALSLAASACSSAPKPAEPAIKIYGNPSASAIAEEPKPKPWAEACQTPEDSMENGKIYRAVVSKGGSFANVILEVAYNGECELHLDKNTTLYSKKCSGTVDKIFISANISSVLISDENLSNSPYSKVADSLMREALKYTCPENIELHQWEKDLKKVLGPYE